MRRLPALLFVLLLTVTPGLHGQQTEELQLPGQGDVRIIVDISGSMKANDPNNLRQPAVRLLARMIPEGAEAGVWTFGQWVNMLVPHGKVDEAWRSNAVDQSRKINSVALRTNLGEAIEKASDPYLSGQDLGNTDFILLTDGKVDLADDPAVNAAERRRILGPLLGRLTDRGATLHTVALSEEADLKMLEALAAESGGHFSLTASAEGLNRAFLKALNAAVPQDQIPLDEEGFTVDSGVEEFTALIFWGEDETSETRALDLISPGGATYSKNQVAGKMRWAAETGYDLITVTDPEAGDWQVNGELGEGSRVTVVSDLRMVVSPVPPTFTADEPISLKIAFFEEDSRIENPDFLNVIDVIVRLTSSDGRSGSKILGKNQPPADGIYTDQIASLPAAGDYDLEIIADGTTFSRQFSAVTRFIAPESAAPTSSEPESSKPESSEPEPVAPEPETEPAEPTDVPESGPIDISEVEEPPAPEEPVQVPAEPETQQGMPFWIWAAAGGTALLLIAGGLWFWFSRKNSGKKGDAEEDSDELEPAAEVEPEPEPEPEESDSEEPEPEPENEASDDESDNDGDESDEEVIPELDESEDATEPEPEVSKTPEDEEIPELEPEQESESESVSESDEESAEDDDEEFGLEDFDLSEFDDLPEDKTNTDEDDPKKGE